MLVLARKQGQGVWIGGTLVRVEIRGAIVKLAIDAPAEVRVWREELVEDPEEEELAELPRMGSSGGMVPELAITG